MGTTPHEESASVTGNFDSLAARREIASWCESALQWKSKRGPRPAACFGPSGGRSGGGFDCPGKRRAVKVKDRCGRSRRRHVRRCPELNYSTLWKCRAVRLPTWLSMRRTALLGISSVLVESFSTLMDGGFSFHRPNANVSSNSLT